jgi:signal transduction histidine kinase
MSCSPRRRYRRCVVALTATGGADRTDETPRLADVVLAVALAVFGQLDLRFNLDNSTHYGSGFATAVVVAVATLALAWRRRWPFATLCVVTGAVAGPELFGTLTFTLWGHFVPLLVAAYSAARWCSGRLALVSAALVGATIAVVLLDVPASGSAGNIPFAVVPAAALMIAGQVLQRRQAHAEELAERARRLETHHEAEVQAAVTAERNRIARELHDVVAHCVSVMVVQAGVSEALLDGAPERAREPLQAVQETGRQAVAELTRMLGLLRGGTGDSSYQLAPQPGVAQLPELVERLTASGLDVRLRSVGEVRPLPPGVDLTVFRIVQEALTNALKHAGAHTMSQVELRYLPRTIEIEVDDDGPGAVAPTGGGHGLIGMAERVSVFGGSIQTGVRPEGGFRVYVALPVEQR